MSERPLSLGHHLGGGRAGDYLLCEPVPSGAFVRVSVPNVDVALVFVAVVVKFVGLTRLA